MSEKKIFKEIDKDWADQQKIDGYCAQMKRSLRDDTIPIVKKYMPNARGEAKEILKELEKHEQWFRLGRRAKDVHAQMVLLDKTMKHFIDLQKRLSL
jgi:hypothetical protein